MPGWAIWGVIALLVICLNKIIPWIREKTRPKDQRLLRDITEWKQQHLTRRTVSKKRVWAYRSGTGNIFLLGDRDNKIKTLSDRAVKLCKVFQERQRTRKSLQKELRKDPMISRIEESFLSVMEQYLTEMNMFQYDRIEDREYSRPALSHIELLLENAAELMQHYGDYMLSLTQAAAADTETERETIETAVQSMALAVAQTRDDIPLPEKTSLPEEAEGLMMQQGESEN